MYEDKTLVCKECGAEFVFSAGEQEFYASMPKKASRTSPRDARRAEKRRRKLPKLPEKCTPQSAQSAARKQRFPLLPLTTDLFTAANALQQ